mgnify:CR=1 FL=1
MSDSAGDDDPNFRQDEYFRAESSAIAGATKQSCQACGQERSKVKYQSFESRLKDIGSNMNRPEGSSARFRESTIQRPSFKITTMTRYKKLAGTQLVCEGKLEIDDVKEMLP